MSLNTAWRLDAAETRATLYGADCGLKTICLFSVGILRSDGRFRPDFGVACTGHQRIVKLHNVAACIVLRNPGGHASANALKFASFCATTSMRHASALRLLESSIRTFASTPLLDKSGLASMGMMPPVR